MLPALFQFIRFGNCCLAALSVWVGSYLTAGVCSTVDLWAATIGAFLICAAGNAVNDLVDLKVDKISHPNRPLPSGRISIRSARSIAVTCHLLAIPPMIICNWNVAVLGLVAMLTLLAYNVWLKRVPILGNAAVAGVSALTFLCGGLAVDAQAAMRLPGPLIAAGFAFFFHLVREIVKDVEDSEGDASVGTSSLAHVAGPRGAILIALLLFIVLVWLTVWPFISGWYGQLYLLIVLVAVDLPPLVLLWRAWRRPTKERVQWSRAGLKIGMVLGLVALVIT